MKVAIFALESSRKKYIDQIIELFKSVDGIIEFEKIDANENLQHQHGEKTKLDITDIISINGEVRDNNPQTLYDFVIMLTTKDIDISVPEFSGDKNWNSVIYHGNIAVNCSHRWSKITDGRIHLAVGHQILENIFQAISKMELNSIIQLEAVHQDTDICINDYCKNIEETKGKIRSGFVCKVCKERAIDTSDFRYVEHIEKLLKLISDNIRSNHDYKPSKSDLTVRFDDEGNVIIGDKKVEFKKSKISKVNYIFHLINHDIPFSSIDFKEHHVKIPFMELSDLLDHPLGEKGYSSHIKNLRCNHNRSNDIIFEHCKSDVLYSYFKITSQCISQDVYAYSVRTIYNMDVDIDIPPYLEKYRIRN
ncbi:hypothetical protein [Chryseobacterium sp.]|uniref:hypothetical protein n=1 Tax=Chryseobacterium sp. TaxID=1871047 RepID=UPI002899D11D|nr:hypothetical protein [Chryseobacterium sp.]